jgi:hypothetical protein
MQHRRAVLTQRFAVIGRRVAFVGFEIVLGEELVPAREAFIAMDFRDDGGRCYGAAAGVSSDQGFLGDGKVEFEGVDQKVVRFGRKRKYGAAHGETGSLVDVDLIDFKDISSSDSPGDGPGFDLGSQNGTSAGVQDFAVVQTPDGTVGIEDYGSGKYWTE